MALAVEHVHVVRRVREHVDRWHHVRLHALSLLLLLNRLDVRVVHKVASRSVRAIAGRVERPAQLRLVLGVAHHVAQLMCAVRKLTLVAVLARAILLERATQLRLVPRGSHSSRRGRSGLRVAHGRGGRGRLAAVHGLVLLVLVEQLQGGRVRSVLVVHLLQQLGLLLLLLLLLLHLQRVPGVQVDVVEHEAAGGVLSRQHVGELVLGEQQLVVALNVAVVMHPVSSTFLLRLGLCSFRELKI